MICTQCKAQNPETARFCEACGQPLKVAASQLLQDIADVEKPVGQTLRAWNRARMQTGADCPAPVAAAIVRAILAELATVHAGGGAYRNLTPETVRLLAEPSADSAKVTIDSVAAANAVPDFTGYQAPELLTSPESAQAPSDIYSLSAMFYEMLVGVLPQNNWQPPGEGRDDVPAGVDKLVERGLSTNPRARQQSVAEYAAELDAALAGAAPDAQPVTPPAPEPPPEPAKKPEPPVAKDDEPKRPAFALSGAPLFIAAGVGAAAIVAALVFAVMQFGGDTEPRTVASKTEEPDPPPLPPPPPPPPPPSGPNYAAFSGNWADDFGNTWSMSVGADGSLRGRAISGSLTGVNVSGQFNGTIFQFQLYNALGVLGGASGGYDGGCHIRYQEADAFGAPTGVAQLHINHVAGAPCP